MQNHQMKWVFALTYMKLAAIFNSKYWMFRKIVSTVSYVIIFKVKCPIQSFFVHIINTKYQKGANYNFSWTTLYSFWKYISK